MFNPELLITLRAVVEEGTVLAAADRLGITASAVSQQLTRLGREVGQPVMLREGRGLVATESARVLVRLGERMLDLDEAARSELERLRDEVSGRITLAGFPTAVRGLLAATVHDLADAHPHLMLTLHEMDPEESVLAVRRGGVDLAVVHDWTDRHLSMHGGIQVWPIGLDPVDLVVRRDHGLPVDAAGIVDLDDLGDQVWIDDGPGVFSDWLLAALQTRRLGYRIGATVEHFPTKVALIQQGFGIGLLPRLGRDRLPAGVVALPLVESPTRRVLAVHRDSSERRPALVAALDAVRARWRRTKALPDTASVPLPLD